MKVGVGVGSGHASRAERSCQLGQRAGVPGRKRRCRRVAQRVAVCGLLERVAGVWVGWPAQPVLAPARSLAAALTSFFPVAARPHHRRPRGPRCAACVRACASPANALQPPRAAAAGANLACRHPCFVIVPEPFSCIGN